MDKQEFNEAIARLDGYTKLTSVDPERFSKGDCYYEWVGAPDYYSDLNLLMPLAWKYGVAIQPMYKMDSDERLTFACWSVLHEKSTPNQDSIEAIRQCLWSIAESEKDELG